MSQQHTHRKIITSRRPVGYRYIAVPRKDICNITRSQPSIHNDNTDHVIRASIIRDLLLIKYMNRTDISSPVLDIDDIN